MNEQSQKDSFHVVGLITVPALPCWMFYTKSDKDTDGTIEKEKHKK